MIVTGQSRLKFAPTPTQAQSSACRANNNSKSPDWAALAGAAVRKNAAPLGRASGQIKGNGGPRGGAEGMTIAGTNCPAETATLQTGTGNENAIVPVMGRTAPRSLPVVQNGQCGAGDVAGAGLSGTPPVSLAGNAPFIVHTGAKNSAGLALASNGHSALSTMLNIASHAALLRVNLIVKYGYRKFQIKP